jgi:hypothetical protein
VETGPVHTGNFAKISGILFTRAAFCSRTSITWGIIMISGRRVRKLVGIGVAASLAGSPVIAAKPAPDTCWMATEREAYELRALQSLLMVASLKCNIMGETSVADGYNRFVTASQGLLSKSASVLMLRFKRLGGGSAASQMDDFTTELANGFSATAMGANACAKAADAADMAASLTPSDLAQLARTLTPLPATRVVCAMDAVRSAAK